MDELHTAPGSGRDSRVVMERHGSDLANLETIYSFRGVKSAVSAGENFTRVLDGHRRRAAGQSSGDARLAAAAAVIGGIPAPPESAGGGCGALQAGGLNPLKAILKAGTARTSAARAARVQSLAKAPLQLRAPSQADGGRLAENGLVPTLGVDLRVDDQPVDLCVRARPLNADGFAGLFTKVFDAGDAELDEAVKGVMVGKALTGTVVSVGAMEVDDMMVLFTEGLESAGLNRVGQSAAIIAFSETCRARSRAVL